MSLQSGIETENLDRGLTPRALAYRSNRLLSLLPGIALHRYVFVLQPVASLPTLPRPYEARSFLSDDPMLASLWPEQALRAARFGQGARCLTVETRDRLVAGLWFIDQSYVEDEVRARYEFGPELSWDFGLFIPPAFRATRAFAALWGAAALDLAARKKIGSLSRIADHLAPSLRSHQRMKAKSIGQATFLTLGQRQYCWSAGHFEQRDAPAGPCFRFPATGQI